MKEQISRDEIAVLIRGWIGEGLLVSKRGTGLTYGQINSMISHGEFFATSFESVLALSEDVRDEFEELVKAHRVMDSNGVKSHQKFLTLYAITLACANGKLLRVDDLGKRAVLYID